MDDSTPATGAAPAGWYPQGEGWLRYWDGARWTEHVSPEGTTPENQAQVAPVQPTQPSGGWRKVAIGAGIGLGVLAVGVGAFFGIKALTAGENQEESAFAMMPTAATLVDLSTLGSDLKLMPIEEQGQLFIAHGADILIGVENDELQALVAIDPESSTAYPSWQWTFPADAGACHVTSSSIDCEGQGLYKITDSGPVPVVPKPTAPSGSGTQAGPETASPSPEDQAGPETERPSEEKPDEEVGEEPYEEAEEGTVEGPEEELGSQPGTQNGQSGAEPEEGSGKAGIPASVSVALEKEPNQDVPYAVTGSSLVDKDGAVLATGLSAGSYWTLHDSSDTWVISNGIDLLGVKGSEVLWEDQLPSGSSEVNGFDTETGPTWAISGDVFLVATPQAVLALDAQTGEEQWMFCFNRNWTFPAGGIPQFRRGWVWACFEMSGTPRGVVQHDPSLTCSGSMKEEGIDTRGVPTVDDTPKVCGG